MKMKLFVIVMMLFSQQAMSTQCGSGDFSSVLRWKMNEIVGKYFEEELNVPSENIFHIEYETHKASIPLEDYVFYAVTLPVWGPIIVFDTEGCPFNPVKRKAKGVYTVDYTNKAWKLCRVKIHVRGKARFFDGTSYSLKLGHSDLSCQ